MRGHRTLTLGLRAGIPALLVAVAVSREGRVSIQAWLAAAAVWITATLLWDFVAAAGVQRGRRLRAWRSTLPPVRGGSEARGLRNIGVLLANAQRNPRVHTNHLRDRLVELAEHYLPLRHGLDPAVDSAGVAELLGDAAWLIDPAVDDRCPTQAELRRFLDVVLGEQQGAPA